MLFLKNFLIVIGLAIGVLILVIIWQVMPWNKSNLVSPVQSSKVAFSENIWIPKLFKSLGLVQPGPEVSARAAFFVDLKSGKSLYEKNIDEQMPIASLTKIMTAIIVLEHKDWEDKFYVSPTAAATEPDKMYLKASELLTVEELMKGLFLVSANDAAEVFAEELLGDREEFIQLMNTKAKQLGMNNTWFINPTGLQEDNRRQYSNAVDVAMMARYLINRWGGIVEITRQNHILIPMTSEHQDYDLYSGINLLTTYPGVVGLKTGYTPEAGLTLVTLARVGDAEVMGVLLGSENRRDDARLLLDYSFAQLGVKVDK